MFADTFLIHNDEAEVACSAYILGRTIRYTQVDARTGLSAGRDPLPCLIQAADGSLFHISHQAAPPPELPPASDDYVKVLDDLYPMDSPQRIVLGVGQMPFFICIPIGSPLPDGYTEYTQPLLDAGNILDYNRYQDIICVHNTSKFAPRSEQPSKVQPAPLSEYQIPFQNKEDALINGLIKEIIKRRVDKMYGKSSENRPALIKKLVYAPMIHLCNTSGSGKTRTALELGKYTNVIYMKYAGSNGTTESVTATYLIKFIQEKCRDLHFAECYSIQHAVIQRLIYICCKFCHATSYTEGSIEIDNAVKWYCQSAELSEDLLSELLGGIRFDVMSDELKDLFDTGKFKGILESSDTMSFDGKSLAVIERLNSEWLKNRADSMPSRLKMSNDERNGLKHLPNLTFVFDEAFALMKKSEGESKGAISVFDKKVVRNTDCYYILRGALRHYAFYWDETISITVSTVAKYSQFYPPLRRDPSFRERKVIPMLPPIVLTGTFDSFNHGTVNSSDFKEWLTFIFSFERCMTIVNCGRPLWAVIYGMMMLGTIQDLKSKRLHSCGYDVQLMKDPFNFLPDDSYFDLAASKISPNIKLTDSGLTVILDDNALVSLLSLSIAMTKFPCRVDSAKLVRTGGMCLFNVDRQDFKAAFLSEGILNGTASYVVVSQFDEILKHLGELFTNNSVAFIMKGEVGEIVERLLIINSVVKARRGGLCKALGCIGGNSPVKNICRTVFEPVGLADFLVEYVGKKATDKYMESCSGLEGSFVAFNHFDYMGGDDVADSPYDAMANYLSRGAALVPRPNTPGFDALLPLVLSDGRLSFVYIQTKMGSSQPYLKLPTAKNIRLSSPLSRWADFYSGDLENWDPNTPIPPYAYIYHHINSSKYEFAVKDVKDDEQEKCQQPCLAVSGVYANDTTASASVIKLVRLFEGVEVEPWLVKNASMLRAWKLPSTDPYVRVDFDKRFSLAPRMPTKYVTNVGKKVADSGKTGGKRTIAGKKRPSKKAKSS